jgi:cytoskeletal protein CcmA (bactofilin family)/uncharacterized membrane protein
MKLHFRPATHMGQTANDERAGRATRHLRRSSLVLRIILLVSLLLPASAAAQPSEGALVIPAGTTYTGNLATVTRDVRVDGVVAGDVTSWSGDIEVRGRVDGDVVSYSGRVTLAAGAQVGGNILAAGGALRLDAGVAVAGQAIRGEGGGTALANLLDLFSPADADGGAAIGRALFGVALGVFLLAFMLLCIAFWPHRTAVASQTLRRVPGRSAVLGLLTTLLLALALPALVALLAATLIGLPLVVVLLVVAQAPYVYGLATLVRMLGASRPQARAVSPLRAGEGPNRITLVAAAVLGLLIALGALLEPFWGLALFYVLASPGLGAVLLSRGGLVVPAYEWRVASDER